MISIVNDEILPAAALPCSRRCLYGLLDAMQARARELLAKGRIPQVPDNVLLALVTDREMADINRSAMQVQGPTNILSFPDDDSSEGTAQLALDVAMLHREAYLYGQKPLEHLVRLAAHGLAHVCGYDHSEEMDVCQDALAQAGLHFLLGERG